MDWKLEVVVISVADVDRAKTFYAEKVGFNVDVDNRLGENFRNVQLTPHGSACSVTIGATSRPLGAGSHSNRTTSSAKCSVPYLQPTPNRPSVAM